MDQWLPNPAHYQNTGDRLKNAPCQIHPPWGCEGEIPVVKKKKKDFTGDSNGQNPPCLSFKSEYREQRLELADVIKNSINHILIN